MPLFSQADETKLRGFIAAPWDKLKKREQEFDDLLADWKFGRPRHLPATRELLCRNAPPLPDTGTLGLSRAGQRFLEGYQLRRAISAVAGEATPDQHPSSTAETSTVNVSPAGKAMLIMFGYSSEQLALSMAFHYKMFGCRHFIPFCGEDLKGQRADVMECLKDALREAIPELDGVVPPDSAVPRIVEVPNYVDDSSLFVAPIDAHDYRNEFQRTGNPSDVFRVIAGWLKDPPEPYRGGGWGYALEVTGGQKTMDAGATAVASYYGLPAFYLDSKKYDSQLRRPDPQSARCRLLMLPAASFSHRARQAIVERFSSRDFGVALDLAEEVRESMERADAWLEASPADAGSDSAQEFFAPKDRDDMEKAVRLLATSRDFMDSTHAAPVNDRLSLADVLASWGATEARSETIPSDLIESLLDHVAGETARVGDRCGDWRIFFDYATDEYYRLRAMMGDDSTAVRRPAAHVAPVAHRNYREVLLAGLGLAELLCEAMIRAPKIIVERVTHASHVAAEPTARLDPSGPAAETLTGGRVDPAIWHMNYDKKWELLKNGRTKMASLWLRDDNGRPSLSRPRPTNRTGRFEVKVDLVVETGRSWVKNLGKFGQRWGAPYQDEPWKQARNTITHLRAPLDDTSKQLAIRSVEEYLPRLIELLYRLASTREPVDCADSARLDRWVTWNKPDSPWSPRQRVPWIGEEGNLRRYLAIELISEDEPERTEVDGA